MGHYFLDRRYVFFYCTRYIKRLLGRAVPDLGVDADKMVDLLRGLVELQDAAGLQAHVLSRLGPQSGKQTSNYGVSKKSCRFLNSSRYLQMDRTSWSYRSRTVIIDKTEEVAGIDHCWKY